MKLETLESEIDRRIEENHERVWINLGKDSLTVKNDSISVGEISTQDNVLLLKTKSNFEEGDEEMREYTIEPSGVVSVGSKV